MRYRGDLERCGPAPSRRDAAPTESLRDFHGKPRPAAGTMTKARASPDEAWVISIDPQPPVQRRGTSATSTLKGWLRRSPRPRMMGIAALCPSY